MPALETLDLYETAVVWMSTGRLNRYGILEVSDPVEIKVRWENDRKELLNSKGDVVGVDATVVVAQDIAVGSRMWLGEISDFPGSGSIGNDDDVMQVLLQNRCRDIKGRAVRRELGLVRYKAIPDDQG